jgi:hypothetical protein
MSTTREELERALREIDEQRRNDAELARQRQYVEDARRHGLLRKRSYDIPPIDTVGRTGFRSGTDTE